MHCNASITCTRQHKHTNEHTQYPVTAPGYATDPISAGGAGGDAFGSGKQVRVCVCVCVCVLRCVVTGVMLHLKRSD